jgi:hypothetical protein
MKGDLRVIFTEIRRFLFLPLNNKVRKRLTKKLLASYSWKYESLPRKYLGRNLTEETVREVVGHDDIGYLYSL